MLFVCKECWLKLRKFTQFRFGLVLAIGAIVALVLCVQCVRTYLYTDAFLVPQQAEREAERQMGALTTAARSAGTTDPRALRSVIEHTVEAASDRVLWMRILDLDGRILAEGGNPQGSAKIPARLWENLQAHKNLGVIADTSEGKAFVATLPFRMPRPANFSQAGIGSPDSRGHPPGAHRPAGYLVQLAIPLKAVASAFDGLRQNLIVGVIASITLLLSLVFTGLRTPGYIRGKYLESELLLARRVQNDLQPSAQPISPHVEFGACSIAADHVGGDFYDIFEADSGKIGIVLGDVSGKGVPAALLVSVLQGAIRSSTASKHELACERINRMLCERTACERFATLFWGVYDPARGTLNYVNAGHAAPMLVRNGQNRIERLHEGGPVLGLLPAAAYSAGTVQIAASDMLILYSDGINEATDRNDQEFGEGRIERLLVETVDAAATEVCGRIMKEATAFARAGAPPDDRTLVVVRFMQAEAVFQQCAPGEIHALAAA